LVEAVITASSVFVVLYVLCIVSYLRSESSVRKRLAAAALLAFLLSTRGGAGLRALYPVIVLGLSVAFSILRASQSRRAGQETCPCPWRPTTSN
jgi:amino acid efflux transporter